MDSATDLIAALATSAVVSTVVSFIFNVFVEARIKHHFELQLERLRQSHTEEMEKIRYFYDSEMEKLKASLIVEASSASKLSERRLDVYAEIVEMVYRTRNIAREIVKNASSSDALTRELIARAEDLELRLYANRLYLQQDGTFTLAHEYKNTVVNFAALCKEFNLRVQQQHPELASDVLSVMGDSYMKIEGQHEIVINVLSGRSISTMKGMLNGIES